jgi:hypothetical protein
MAMGHMRGRGSSETGRGTRLPALGLGAAQADPKSKERGVQANTKHSMTPSTAAGLRKCKRRDVGVSGGRAEKEEGGPPPPLVETISRTQALCGVPL